MSIRLVDRAGRAPAAT